jgi:hypothetical protein
MTGNLPGWSHEELSWPVWFEAGVQKPDGTCPPRRAIQKNLHAMSTPKSHINVWDFRSDDQGVREWLSAIEGGDLIQVFPKARFSRWCNYVSHAKIPLWTDDVGSVEEVAAVSRPKLLRSMTKAPMELVESVTEVSSLLRRTTS